MCFAALSTSYLLVIRVGNPKKRVAHPTWLRSNKMKLLKICGLIVCVYMQSAYAGEYEFCLMTNQVAAAGKLGEYSNETDKKWPLHDVQRNYVSHSHQKLDERGNLYQGGRVYDA
jgi:hypothetical protein